MQLSMTGYGAARTQTDALGVSVEVRAVNNRYLKVSIRCPDVLFPLEGEIEKVVRESIARGTVQLTIRVESARSGQQYQIDEQVLQGYCGQLAVIAAATGLDKPNRLDPLLLLPGVVTDRTEQLHQADVVWPIVRDTLRASLAKLQEFRTTEGASMVDDLRRQIGVLREQLAAIAVQAPKVVTEFRQRMLDRVRELVAESGINVDEASLIREVSIFADRCDINEEIMRLHSHLDQFEQLINGNLSQGRKLDFLGQEIFREVNTIGSKANNVVIAHCVVEMKGAVERIREVLQNVE